MTDKERLEAVIDEIKRRIGEYYDRDTPVSLDKADALQCILDYADSVKNEDSVEEKLFSEEYEENFEDEFAKTLAERRQILPHSEDRFSDMDLYHVALHFNGWKKWKMTKDVITGDVDFYEHGPIICTHPADVQKLVDKHHLKQDDEVRLVLLTED